MYIVNAKFKSSNFLLLIYFYDITIEKLNSIVKKQKAIFFYLFILCANIFPS